MPPIRTLLPLVLAALAGSTQAADFPARNARFLVGFPPGGAVDTFARVTAQKLTYASSGTATTSHMAAELLATSTGIRMTHVPYKGAAAAVQDLVAGRVDLMLDPIISSAGHVKAGKLRALGVTTAMRTSLLPELPTLAEAGVPGYEFEAWFGIIAPAKTPADIVAKVNQDVGRLIGAADVKERLSGLGAVPAPSVSPAQMNTFLAGETARWAKVVKSAGIRVE